jgi:hypothetical protein
VETRINKERLARELDQLQKHLLEIESKVGDTLGDAADVAVRKVRHLVGPEPVDAEQREHLIRQLAELKSRRRGDHQALSHWLEAEEEVDLLLRTLGLRE